MAQQRKVNGVNVDRMSDMMKAMTDKPDLAKFKFRAHNKWINGGHSRTTIRDFYGAGKEDTSRTRPFVLESDEPDVLLGENHGPNATEAALYALASCLNTTFIYYAAARGVNVKELEIDVEGDLDLRGFLGISDRVGSGYQDIGVVFRAKADATKDEIEELCRLAQKHSPVFNSIANAVPVRARVEIK